MSPKWISLGVFFVTYILLVVLPMKRTWVVSVASLILILTGTMPFESAFKAINWNVMGIFVGTLVLADIFLDSRMPAYIAERIVNRASNTCTAVLWICGLTGFISMFVENVATVLIVAPIALSLAKKINLNPKNMMIAIAISSNLQGASTLIGDPPSMLLGGFAKMNFGDFFLYQGKPSIFFAVQSAFLAATGVLFIIFCRHKEKTALVTVEKIKTWVPTGLLIALIIILAVVSFYDKEFSSMAGIVCMIFGVISLFWDRYFNNDAFSKTIKSLDWDTTFFLMGIFILVGSLTSNGWVEVMAQFLAGLVGDNVLLAFVLLISVSLALSAFIDNVPYLAAMLPVALIMSEKLGISPALLLFGLMIAASVGGNITPIGASANIVACGLLKKEGYPVTFKEFVAIGLPYTIVATLVASIFIWVVFGPKL